MDLLVTLRRGMTIAALACACAMPALAQETNAITTEEVREEIAEAMDAVAEYSEQERDKALTEAREALNQIDAVIERREQAMRENWAEMSDAARETARARLRDLREARNALGERYGALQSGASGAWEELKTGFSNAWDAFSEAWNAADDEEYTKVGTITCFAEQAAQLTEPVQRNISCRFEQIGNDIQATYTGELIHHGPNLELNVEEVLVWTVWAPENKQDSSSLIGHYYGLRADDPDLPGSGANRLLGDGERPVLLEPFIDPGVASGPQTILSVIELELRPARI